MKPGGLLFLILSCCAELWAVPGALAAEQPAQPAAVESGEQALERRLRQDARAAHDPRARAIQSHALLRGQGAGARRNRRSRARIRALHQQEIREAARQASPDRVHRRDPAREAVLGRGRGAGRHCRRQPHGDRRAAQARGFHRAYGSQAGAGAARHRAGIARGRHARRSLRQDAARAQGDELLRKRAGAERAPEEGGKGAGEHRRAARRAGGRGHARDAQRGRDPASSWWTTGRRACGRRSCRRSRCAKTWCCGRRGIPAGPFARTARSSRPPCWTSTRLFSRSRSAMESWRPSTTSASSRSPTTPAGRS